MSNSELDKSEKGISFKADSFLSSADGALDACGLSCPLPLLKAKQGLNRLEAGQVFALVCSDAGSVRDFKVFCEQSGNELLESIEDEGKFYYRLKKV